MIRKETAALILRLHHVEKWPVGTISTQLGLHHDVVERVLSQHGNEGPRVLRPSLVDPYLPFILETLNKYPTLRASRLWRMCAERGYRGAEGHFRHILQGIRPKPAAEAYLRLRTLPAEQAQVDWAHFGKVQIGRAQRSLMAFLL
ncbi:MAG: IS21 family transposase, partial [bacterium]